MNRKNFDARQWTEQVEMEMKHFKLFEHFTPNLKMSPVTGKFYSRYDALPAGDTSAEQFVQRIQAELEKGPKDKADYPATTAQEYGWYLEPLIDRDICDRRLHHPRQSTAVSKWGDYVSKFKNMTR